jgi:hypothetical protein
MTIKSDGGIIVGSSTTSPGSGNLALADAKGLFDSAGNEQLIFQETASAVNYLEVTNAATGGGPIIAANGSDSDVPITLRAKGASTTPIVFDLGTGNFPDITFTTVHAGVGGTGFVGVLDSSSPAAGDFLTYYVGKGRNSSNALVDAYGKIHITVIDPTAASEDGKISFQPRIAGANSFQLQIADGVLVRPGGANVDTSDSFPGSGNLGIEDSGEFRFYETEANGDNYFAFIAPDALGGNVTCTIDASGRIPDSCVGDGTDGGSQTPWASDIDADAFNLIDADVIVRGAAAQLATFQSSAVTPPIQILGTDLNSSAVVTARFSNNASSTGFRIAKSRGGTVGTYTVVNDQDQLGHLVWEASDGTDFGISAEIKALVDGSPGDNDLPGRLELATTPEAAAAATTRLVIKPDGGVIIGPNDTSGGAKSLTIDDQGTLEFGEAEANGDSAVTFAAPAALGADRTCVFEDDANPIPDSCVGDGTDGGGSFDGTALTTVTWGSSNFTTHVHSTDGVDLTWDYTTNDGFATLDGGGSSPGIILEDQGAIRFFEEDAGGSNYKAFAPPAAITADTTCTFEDDANFIPDSCVGDGTDASGIANLVDDTTPQLGGALDTNGHAIEFGTANTDTSVVRSAAGRITVEGNAVEIAGRQMLWIPAAGMVGRVTTGADCSTLYDSGTSDVTIRTCSFADGSNLNAQFQVQMPKSWDEGTVTFETVWTTASGTGTFEIELGCVAISNDDTLNVAMGTAQASSDTLLAVNDQHTGPESSAITCGGTPAENDFVAFNVMRDATNDTLNATAQLIGIKLYVTTNAANDL